MFGIPSPRSRGAWRVRTASLITTAACALSIGLAGAADAAPTASFSGPATTAKGTTVTFDGSSSTGVAPVGSGGGYPGETTSAGSYFWDFGDGFTTATDGPVVQHRFKYAGPVNVALTVYDADHQAATATRSLSVTGATSLVDPAGCSTSVLPRNDDGSSALVSLPFSLDFFGRQHDALYVNNNGNVTFDEPLSEFTPFDLTSTEREIIAAFFADVDTRANGSEETKWGTTTYGGRQAFCVTWGGVAGGVGYYGRQADKLNRLQLLLVDRGDVHAGDFDIIFNYDGIEWETGSASGGSNGFGGSAARVGYSNGTGSAGSSLELVGSATHGAFLDGGPNALATGNRGTLTPGRYLFEVRGGQAPTGGSVRGRTRDADGTGIPAALVQACPSDEGYPDAPPAGGQYPGSGRERCVTTRAGSNGSFSFSGLGAGVWRLEGRPPSSDTTHTAVTSGPILVKVDETAVNDLVLGRIQPVPADTAVESQIRQTPDGTPVVFYHDPIRLSTHGCPEGTAHYAIRLGGSQVRAGELAPVPGDPGHFRGEAAALYPLSGSAQITISVTGCSASGDNESATFTVYIDPSGVVSTPAGLPVAGATVTLLRSDVAGGPFAVVPDGSDIMAPSNRKNPDTTSGSGAFAWDVVAGFYKVRATKPGCHKVGDPATDAAETAVLEIPPPAVNLDLRLDCGPAVATADATELAFGTVRTGVASPAKTVKVGNAGADRMTVGTPVLDGTDKSDFSVANGCPATIDPGQSCSVTVVFTPGAAGARSASLDVPTSVGAKHVTLGGSGETPAGPGQGSAGPGAGGSAATGGAGTDAGAVKPTPTAGGSRPAAGTATALLSLPKLTTCVKSKRIVLRVDRSAFTKVKVTVDGRSRTYKGKRLKPQLSITLVDKKRDRKVQVVVVGVRKNGKRSTIKATYRLC